MQSHDGTRQAVTAEDRLDIDRTEITSHIHRIFQAFIAQDRETLRQTHSRDWTGFMGPSVGIERGLEAYMANAEKSLQNFRGHSYAIDDLEIELFGEVAVVYYVARYNYITDSGPAEIPLRSVDIYGKRDGHWIQIGSHITVIPSSGAWGEGSRGGTAPTDAK